MRLHHLLYYSGSLNLLKMTGTLTSAADSRHVCFKVSSALRITSCQAGMSLRGWYIGLSSRAASSLADFHSLPFIWSCVLFHSQFPSPSETHSFPSCPSFCFALSLPLFHLKSYHQLPSANHFLSRELWIKFKSVEFRLPPSLPLSSHPLCLSASNFLPLWAVTSHPHPTASHTRTLGFFDWAVCYSPSLNCQSEL